MSKFVKFVNRTFGADLLDIIELSSFNERAGIQLRHPPSRWMTTQVSIEPHAHPDCQELARYLGRFSYGRNFPIPWSLTLTARARETHVEAELVLRVIDVEHANEMIEVKSLNAFDTRIYTGLSLDDMRERASYEFRRQLEEVLKHETQEHFTFDGNRICHPHEHTRR